MMLMIVFLSPIVFIAEVSHEVRDVLQSPSRQGKESKSFHLTVPLHNWDITELLMLQLVNKTKDIK
jgi:hypothetical protein